MSDLRARRVETGSAVGNRRDPKYLEKLRGVRAYASKKGLETGLRFYRAALETNIK